MKKEKRKILVNSNVKIIGKIEIDNENYDTFCSSQSMSDEQKESFIKKSNNNIKEINKRIEKGLQGRIASEIFEGYYLVKFEDEAEYFQYSIDGYTFDKRQFLVLKEENIEMIEGQEIDNVSLAIINQINKIHSDIISKLKRCDSDVNSCVNAINENKKSTLRYIKTLNECKDRKELMMKSLENNMENKERVSHQVEKLKKNEKIEKIEYYSNQNEDYILVRTKPLMYKSDRVNYNQGYFTIMLELKNSSIRVYGSRYFRSYCNPCISMSSVCFGEASRDYTRMLEDGNVVSLILMIINFLEEPNYYSPYISDYDTYFGQDLKKNAEFDFDKLSNYVDNRRKLETIISDNFNQEKYDKDRESKNGKRISRTRNGEHNNDEDSSDEDDRSFE